MPARHTLLVVDDEPDVVKSVQDLLHRKYRVLGATSAKEALDLMEREEVHLVMSDQRMPETTGVEFLRNVRGEFPEAIRLLFTGYADIRAVIDAINQGNVYRYITKPWDPDELQTVIDEAAERYDLIVERNRLVSLLQQQNKELENANAALKRANELKQAFIQVASHELRTPLAILMGIARLAGENADEATQPWLKRIEQAGQRLGRLVDQIVAMLIAGQFETTLDRRETDLATLLNQAAEDVRPFIELRRQKLSVDVPPDLGAADLEPDRIRDSINHLLLNAIKFTPDGGSVSLAASGNADEVQIRVSDTGAGIEPAAMERLFEPFFTGFDVSRHSSGHYEHGRKGIGLGLSVVKAFVKLHGGTIAAQSQPGSGTTFTIVLPRRRPQATTRLESSGAP
ncbi:MAG TPA: hybrid sensor histidine kinase/response regulator [Tepidisphaeraceae bacterium]|nr:hybrid sensor histidine kinase/response regulator [Tepidisphaeraceae bacterium]